VAELVQAAVKPAGVTPVLTPVCVFSARGGGLAALAWDFCNMHCTKVLWSFARFVYSWLWSGRFRQELNRRSPWLDQHMMIAEQSQEQTRHVQARSLPWWIDDASFLRSVGRLLRAAGYAVQTFGSAREFLVSLELSKPGCVVMTCTCRDVRPGIAGPGWRSRAPSFLSFLSPPMTRPKPGSMRAGPTAWDCC